MSFYFKSSFPSLSTVESVSEGGKESISEGRTFNRQPKPTPGTFCDEVTE